MLKSISVFTALLCCQPIASANAAVTIEFTGSYDDTAFSASLTTANFLADTTGPLTAKVAVTTAVGRATVSGRPLNDDPEHQFYLSLLNLADQKSNKGAVIAVLSTCLRAELRCQQILRQGLFTKTPNYLEISGTSTLLGFMLVYTVFRYDDTLGYVPSIPFLLRDFITPDDLGDAPDAVVYGSRSDDAAAATFDKDNYLLSIDTPFGEPLKIGFPNDVRYTNASLLTVGYLPSGRIYNVMARITGLPDPIVTPLPAVPEPSTWAMLIAGFGVIGAGMRRRRVGWVAAHA